MGHPETGLLLAQRYELRERLVVEGRRRIYQAFDHLTQRPVVLKGLLEAFPAVSCTPALSLASSGPTLSSNLPTEEEPLPGTARPQRPLADALLTPLTDTHPVARELLHITRLAPPPVARALEPGLAWPVPQEPLEVGLRFFAQEWIDGPSLLDLRGNLSPDEVHACLLTLLSVVAYLHHQGLTQLDLKSEHLIKSPTGWRLIDLDQARLDRPLGERELHGTQGYLAPEVLSGGPGGMTADLYSVGMILFEALTGDIPALEGTTLESQARFLRLSPPPELPPSVHQTTPQLATLCTRLLSREPSARPPSAVAVLEELGVQDWRARAPLPRGSFLPPLDALQTLAQLARDAELSGGGGARLLSPPRGGQSELLLSLCYRLRWVGFPALLLDPRELPATPLGAVQLCLRHLRSLTGLPVNQEGPPLPMGDVLEETRLERARWAVRQLRDAAAEASTLLGSPIPLLLDHAESLDELSKEAFRLLEPHLPGSGLFLLQALQEPAPASPLPAIRLPAWTREKVRVHAEDLLGPGSLSALEVEHLLEGAEGSPGWTRDALAVKWRCPDGTLPSLAARDEEALRQCALEGLESSCAQALTALSVLRQPFSTSVAEGLLPPSQAPALLHRLLSSGHLLPTLLRGGEEQGFRFSREVHRRALERGMLEETRQSLHLRAATLLARRRRSDPSLPARAIALHFLEGGAPERAGDFLERAVEEAQQDACLGEAAESLRRLIEVSDPSDPDLADQHLRLGQLEYALGHFEAAEVAYAAALEGARRPAVRLRALTGLGRALLARERLREARDALQLAASPELLAHSQSSEERIRPLHLLTEACLRLGDLPAAEKALELATRAGVPPSSRLHVEQTLYQAWLTLERGQGTPSLLADLEAALLEARDLTFHAGEMRLLLFLARASQHLGDLAQAIRWTETSVEQARALFELPREAASTLNLGSLLREHGQPQDALERYRRAAALYRQLGNPIGQARAFLMSTELLLEGESLDRAEESLGSARQLLERVAGAHLEPAWLSLLEARVHLIRGQREGLRERLSQARKVFLEQHRRDLAAEATAELMALALEEERLDEGWRELSVASSFAQTEVNRATWTRLHRLAARCHQGLQANANPESPALLSAAGEEALHLAWLDRIRRLLELPDDPGTLAASLAGLAGELFDGRGLVYVFHEHGYTLVRGHEMETDQLEDIAQRIIQRVLRTGQAYHCADILAGEDGLHPRSLREARVRSMVCQPVRWQDNLVGALYLDHREAGRVSSPMALRIVEQVAELAASLLVTLPRPQRIPTVAENEWNLVGSSPVMQRLRERMSLLMRSSASDLIIHLYGETGNGKSRVAEILHTYGSRRQGKFIVVNCGAFAENLLEAQLFGSVKGAFTGAEDREGALGEARGGTLFLDEVDSLPPTQQAKLLTALSRRRFYRVGDFSREQILDAHIISASTRELHDLAGKSQFLESLAGRLWSNPIYIPSLRERGQEDIRQLLQYFLDQLPLDRPEGPLSVEKAFSPQARQFLYRYFWPRNVRQLEHMMHDEGIKDVLRAGQWVDRALVETCLGEGGGKGETVPLSQAPLELPPAGWTMAELETHLERLRASYVRREVDIRGGNRALTATEMRYSRSSLYTLLDKHAPEPGPAPRSSSSPTPQLPLIPGAPPPREGAPGRGRRSRGRKS